MMSPFTLIFVWFLVTIKALNGDLFCGQAHECANNVINTDTLFAYGYQSNFGNAGSITAATDVFCYASYACANTSNITSNSGDIFCYGSNACTNTKIYPAWGKNIFCYGSNSCANSIMKTSTTSIDLYCYGHNSCANAVINNFDGIYAYGSYSLHNSIIIANGSTSTTIMLSGYNAGDNLKIICASTDICNIECRGSACDSIIFDCQGNNNCNIQTYTNFYLHSFIFNGNNFPIDANNIDNDLCNNVDSVTVDNQYSNYNASVINQLSSYTNICCRASGSCSDTSTAVSVNNIVCSAAQGTCGKIEINNIFESIYCTGSSSCQSMVINAKNVYCIGNYVCINVNITNAENVYITGWASGDNIIINGVTNLYRLNFNELHQTIISNGNLNAYLLNDVVENSDIQIYCNENDNCMIKCATTRSCIDTRIYCYGNCIIYCKLVIDDQYYICPNVTVINNGTVNYKYIYTDTPTLTPTNQPSDIPTTNNPTTNNPTTYNPTTNNPTTDNPTINNPTTNSPITSNSTSLITTGAEKR
eukprot:438733_1